MVESYCISNVSSVFLANESFNIRIIFARHAKCQSGYIPLDLLRMQFLLSDQIFPIIRSQWDVADKGEIECQSEIAWDSKLFALIKAISLNLYIIEKIAHHTR